MAPLPEDHDTLVQLEHIRQSSEGVLRKTERLSAQWVHGNDEMRVADVKKQLMSKLSLRVIARTL